MVYKISYRRDQAKIIHGCNTRQDALKKAAKDIDVSPEHSVQLQGDDVVLLIMMYFGEGALADEQKADISRKVTDLIVHESKQPKEGTWVVINEIPAENWLLGGLTLPELKARLAAEKT